MRYFKYVIFLLLVLLLASPAQAKNQDFWAEVYTWNGDMNKDGTANVVRATTNITFKVLQRNSDTAETLTEYNDNTYTSLTNPVTTTNFADNAVCNDKVAFRTDPGETDDTYVDVIVTDVDGGYSLFVEDFTIHKHAIVIDESPGIQHTGIIWFAHSTTGEQDTGINFDYDSRIVDVRPEVVEVCAACTIDIGTLTGETSQDSDGFRDGTLLTTAGFVADTGVVTAGTSISYYPDSTYGALLHTIIAGVATASNQHAQGGRSYLGHVVTGANARSLAYTIASTGTTTGEGYIFYDFIRLR